MNHYYLTLALAYLDALENSDLDALGRLWKLAETDEFLERTFGDISEGVINIDTLARIAESN